MRNEKGQFVKGSNDWNGRKHKESSKAKMATSKNGKVGYWRGKNRPTEQDSCHWVGDRVGYGGIHDWVKKWKGIPGTCEKCGRSGLSGKNIHWANIDHKYSRILDDYIRLCAKCHKRYDLDFIKNSKINICK